MDLCLSSGSTPQYANDVVRALAMPRGAILQFRYRDKWLSDAIKHAIRERPFRARDAVIAYVDYSQVGNPTEVVPLRRARVVNAELSGTTYVLDLCLGGFTMARETLAKFNDALSRTAGDAVPKNVNGVPEGLFWFENDSLDLTDESTDLSIFEKLVTSLFPRTEFSSIPLFYHVKGLRDTFNRRQLDAKGGEFTLVPNRPYELEVYEYLPSGALPQAALQFDPGGPYLTITSNPKLVFSSRYDLRKVYLRSADPPVTLNDLLAVEDERDRLANRGVLSVYRVPKSAAGISSSPDKDWDFDLRFKLQLNIGTAVITGMIVGAFVATPSLLSFYGSGKWTTDSGWGIAILIFVISLLAGIGAILGIRKPV